MKFLLTYAFLVLSTSFADAFTVTLARQEKSYISDIAQPIIECAFEKHSWQLNLEIVPWKRAQMGTEYNSYDGFFVATETAARNKYATRSTGVLSNDWLFIQLSSAYVSPLSPSFWQQIFTSNLGTAKLRWLRNKVREGQLTGPLIETNNLKTAWFHLLNGRANILLENRLNFERLKQERPPDIPLKMDVAKKVTQGVYFSNKFLSDKPDFLTDFNYAVQACLTQ